MYKIISVLGSVVFLGIYLIWNQQAWTSQVDDLKLENQRLIEEIEILKVRSKFRLRSSPRPQLQRSFSQSLDSVHGCPFVMETSFYFDGYLFV